MFVSGVCAPSGNRRDGLSNAASLVLSALSSYKRVLITVLRPVASSGAREPFSNIVSISSLRFSVISNVAQIPRSLFLILGGVKKRAEFWDAPVWLDKR